MNRRSSNKSNQAQKMDKIWLAPLLWKRYWPYQRYLALSTLVQSINSSFSYRSWPRTYWPKWRLPSRKGKTCNTKLWTDYRVRRDRILRKWWERWKLKKLWAFRSKNEGWPKRGKAKAWQGISWTSSCPWATKWRWEDRTTMKTKIFTWWTSSHDFCSKSKTNPSLRTNK